MSKPDPDTLRARLLALLLRVLASPWFWGVLGWTLVVLRYTSEVVNPRYGGG